MSRPPGDAVTHVVPLTDVVTAYEALRDSRRARRQRPATQLELAAILGWSEQTLRRFLRHHGLRWPRDRGAPLEFLAGSCEDTGDHTAARLAG